MDMIPQYIEGKRHPETIHYDFPELEPIFKETYGVMTYQEQCMKSAIAVAGYQKHHSDSLRRGIAKKKKELLAEHRGLFIEGRDTGNPHDYIPGGIKTGHDKVRLVEFFDKMEKFGDYCFNKSHAAAYAVLAYVTAWLKYYYPAEFMAANMDEKRKDQALLARYIKHCENDLGIEVTPPTIAESQATFNPVSEKKIVFSLAVKETKNDILVAITAEREQSGPYTSFLDFMLRCWNLIDKDTLKALNYAGAFDVFGIRRSSMAAGIEDIMKAIQSFKGALVRYKNNPKSRRKETPELSEWINDINDFLPNIQEFPDEILLKMEKEYIGVYMTGHPLNKFLCSITNFSNFKLTDLTYDVDEETGAIMLSNQIHDGMRIQLIGQVTEITKLATKKDKIPMASIVLEDLTGTARAVIFPKAYAACSNILVEDQIYRIKGQVQADRDEAPSIIINEITILKNDLHKRIIFHARRSNEESEAFIKYINSLQCYGESPVYIQFGRMRILLKRKYWVDVEIFEQKCRDDIRAKCSINEW
jgi:DNA polymerase-3 subunit alpha